MIDPTSPIAAVRVFPLLLLNINLTTLCGSILTAYS